MHLEAKAGFNAEQPRDDQGRWTNGAEGEEGSLSLVADVDRYSISLPEEEMRGGHAIQTHVGKSARDLISTLNALRIDTPFLTIARDAQGSFDSLESANDFVNRVLQANVEAVDRVANGLENDVWLQRRFGYRTGIEAFKDSADSDPFVRETYEAGVFIRRDPRSPRGYTVVTAYPLNQRAGR
jgi:hypothetical protein